MNEKEKYECGQRIKMLREGCGYTQETLAEMLDISSRSISSYETGSQQPSTSNLLLLSSFFGVNPYYLCFGGDKMSNKYTSEIERELCSIDSFDIIKSIHDLEMKNESILPHLMISDKLIKTIQKNWNKKFNNNKKSKKNNHPDIYATYVGQTIIKYCSHRADLKKKYSL